jgi:hypothetical protein
MPTSTMGQQYWHDPVRCGRCNVRNMEGLEASVLLIAILLGVLLIIGGLVYLLAQRLQKRSPEPPPRKPVNRRIRIGGIVLVLLIIGLWAGIRSASSPQPAGPPPPCPTGPIYAPLQRLCPPS